MEREDVFWRTGTGMLVFIAGFLLAPLVALATMPWLPDGAWPFVWVAVLVPFPHLPERADKRRMRWLRARRNGA